MPFPRVQLIHMAPGAPNIDIYVDDQRLTDDFNYRTATPFIPLVWGTHKIDLVAASARDNRMPLSTSTVTLQPHVNYALVVMGTTPRPNVLMLDHLRLTSSVPDQIEYVLLHAAPDVPALDVRLLDPLRKNPIALLANNLEFGEFRGYWRLFPYGYIFEVTNPDNSFVLTTERFDLPDFVGETIFLIATTGQDRPVQLVGVRASGQLLFDSTVRGATDAADATPEALMLRGNYPNPFNPATTVTFDLPEAATVHLDVIDLLGRTVLTTPEQRVAGGVGQTLAVDASALASGTYLYRVVARTITQRHIRTGTMILAR